MKHPWLGELGSRSILILCPTLSFFPRKRKTILREISLKLAVNQNLLKAIFQAPLNLGVMSHCYVHSLPTKVLYCFVR